MKVVGAGLIKDWILGRIIVCVAIWLMVRLISPLVYSQGRELL